MILKVLEKNETIKNHISQEINSEHESVKGEELKYEWSYCHKRFKQKGNMNKHMKLHLFPNIEERRNFRWDILLIKLKKELWKLIQIIVMDVI